MLLVLLPPTARSGLSFRPLHIGFGGRGPGA